MPDSASSAHEKMLETIIARSWEDPEFKASFIADPRAVLKSEFDYEYPENVTLRVVAESAEERCLVLPLNEEVDPEMSESELETVAGGVTGTSSCTAVGRVAVNPFTKLSSLSALSQLPQLSSLSCAP